MQRQLQQHALRPPPGLEHLVACATVGSHGQAAEHVCGMTRARRRRKQRSRQKAKLKKSAFHPMDVLFDIVGGLSLAGGRSVPMNAVKGMAISVKLESTEFAYAIGRWQELG